MLDKVLLTLMTLAACSWGAQSGAKKNAVPSWLDTIPPRLEIQPRQKYHNAVFQVVLKANKQANILIGIGSARELQPYTQPYSVTKDGPTMVYYYGEDDLGNKSKIDSMLYILDRTRPHLSINPGAGTYRKGLMIAINTDKPSRKLLLKQRADTAGTALGDSLELKESIQGFIAAIDSAGNRTVSDHVRYLVDTTIVAITAVPAGGTYNREITITFRSTPGTDVYYTFDPLAPPKWFNKYAAAVPVPYGMSMLRFFGKDSAGFESELSRVSYVIDTLAPRLHLYVGKGRAVDTIVLSSKKPATIRYTLDGSMPGDSSPLFSRELLVPHKGKCTFKAYGRDESGNSSEAIVWECKYDTIPPVIRIADRGGTFAHGIIVHIASDKPCRILYSLDGSDPSAGLLYSDKGITISRDASTVLRAIGIDEAGNISAEKNETYYLDTHPPVIRVQVEGTLQEGHFLIRLTASKPAKIYYETGNRSPDRSSPLYLNPIPMTTGQQLRYIAVDSAGNISPVGVMDELKKPMVEASPAGGVYNKKLKVTFSMSGTAAVYWRELPDTSYRKFKDTVLLQTEGPHTIEYYSETTEGLKSPVRRNEYYLDWTPPHVDISVKKTGGDSVAILFECTKNATIYYTTDGSNPQFSGATRMAGNKFMTSRDRIVIKRGADVKLAFYAEDAAGNQSSLTVMDVFKPRVVPDVPAGADRLYDRILSVSLNTYDQSSVYFEHHCKTPTLNSPVFIDPITLMQSDTLVAFAIDASGFRGDLDTMVYLIDLPPSPHFVLTSDSIIAGESISFDATSTIDKETPADRLLYRWDFEGDGKFDSDKGAYARVSFTYKKPGNYRPTVEVTDESKRIAVYSRPITVHERCPEGMVSVVLPNNHTFCIDRYEYPNVQGKVPATNVSWVEAKMMCVDQGKRLCTGVEWKYACNGSAQTLYPYGDNYVASKCPSQGKALWKAGSFRECSKNGAMDMLGNAWEWTDDKKGDCPIMFGGSYRFGKDAQCGLQSSGTVATKSDDVGFRCCK